MVMACYFSPCNRYLASAAKDGWLRIWDISSAREIEALKGPDFQLFDCQWSPGGDRIATVGFDGRVQVWDWRNEKIISSIDPGADLLSCCAWTPDGKGLLSQSGKDVFVVWEAGTGTELWRSIKLEDRLSACAFSPDGKYLGVVCGPWITVIGLSSGRPERLVFEKRLDTTYIAGCSFSRDSQLFAYASYQCEVINTDTRVSRVICEWGASDCALSPDGQSIVVAGGSYGDARLEVFDTVNGERIGLLNGHQDLVTSCDWSSDGLIASGSRDGTVKVWDATVPWLDEEPRHHFSRVKALCWHPDGTRVVSASNDGRAHIWDSRSGAWLSTVESRNQREAPYLTGCSSAPDGSAFALSDWNGFVEIFEWKTLTSVLKFQSDEKHVFDCQWSPRGSLVATCGTKGVVIWEAANGNRLGALEGADEPQRVGFSPDGNRIAMWPGAIYDVRTRARILELNAVRSYTWNEVAWSPKGDLLLLGDRDLTVAIIDVDESRAIGRLAGHKGLRSGSSYYGQFAEAAEVLCGFLGEGRFSVTAYVDGLVRVWDLCNQELITQVATDSAFLCIAVRDQSLCLGDDQGHLHWFSVENLKRDCAVVPSSRADACPQCGDRMERVDHMPGAETRRCTRCLHSETHFPDPRRT
jgi:WD40 repeat protein